MFKNSVGLFNISKMRLRIKPMFLEDLYMQDKYSLIMKVQILKCIKSLSSYMSSKMKDHFLEYIQRLTIKFLNLARKNYLKTQKTELSQLSIMKLSQKDKAD